MKVVGLNTRITQPLQIFRKPASVASRLPNLALHGVRTLQVGPALHDPPVGDSPNHNSGEFEPLLRSRIGTRPMVAHHHFVVLGDEVLDAYA